MYGNGTYTDDFGVFALDDHGGRVVDPYREQLRVRRALPDGIAVSARIEVRKDRRLSEEPESFAAI